MQVEVDKDGDASMEDVFPPDKTGQHPLDAVSESMDAPVDPDNQTIITDFLDFTEYLSADVVRSLTLIGKLDETHVEASSRLDDLTKTWGQLPTLPADTRPSPLSVRTSITEALDRSVSSRVIAHAEAVKMAENVNRNYQKAQILLEKLQKMMDNYPTEHQAALRSPTISRSPQLSRSKPAASGAPKSKRFKIPKITVPGEVLAPYDIEYDNLSDENDWNSADDSEPVPGRRTPGPPPRIKLLTNKTPKTPIRLLKPEPPTPDFLSAAHAANQAALRRPPPPDAVVGSTDAPWLQLTDYELAKLRKRMKKNATWSPSDTMIARELKALGRGPDAYRTAKRQAEDEGKTFAPNVPSLLVNGPSGTQQLPAGAISVDFTGEEEIPTSNRGMKLNEAKKLKREALARTAAEEAEESARRMAEAAKIFLGPNGKPDTPAAESQKRSLPNARVTNKRKREAEDNTSGDAAADEVEARVLPKRTRTETPVMPPKHINLTHNVMARADGPTLSTPQLTPGGSTATHVQTPVPIPIPPLTSKSSARSPPASTSSNTTTTVPVKPPAETPVPLPSRAVSNTTVAPGSKRQTRGDAAKQSRQGSSLLVPAARTSPRANSHGAATTHAMIAVAEPQTATRPRSRGKATSQEPASSLAADRPRRASTARNTPAPEAAVKASHNTNTSTTSTGGNRRSKRPAPGVVSTTNSGGNSAVGKRKAAPRKKTRASKKEKDQPHEAAETDVEEVDDEGNPIDPDEPRYCLCNRVSFGVMIQCDNVDNCKLEWFHLECVGLSSIPARTTKWYCPDCRKALGLGEKGQINARGIRK